LGKHSVTLTTGEPICSKSYLLPHAMQKGVEKELDDMLKLRISEPSGPSDVSFIVIVRKLDESNRVCIDFRKLDEVTVFDTKLMSEKVIDPFGSCN